MLRLAFGSAGLLLCLMASAQTTAPVTVALPADAAIVVRGQQGLFFSPR